MANGLKSRAKKAGLSPGTAIFVGKRQVEGLTAQLMDYDEEALVESRHADLAEIKAVTQRGAVMWLDFVGLHEAGKIEEIGNFFKLHPLTVEDVLNTSQRPKVEFFDSYLYMVLRMTRLADDGVHIESEQVSFILGDTFLLSFQERESDIFEPVRGRIRANKGKIRKFGADYLAYSLLDSIVDHYFSVLEALGEAMEDIEDALLVNPGNDVLQRIHALKKEMLLLRRSIWPLRDLLLSLEREDERFFHSTTRIFLRDLYDHTIQVIDTVETYRDLTSGLLDLYVSTVGNKLNEIMKILTIFTAIFIPMTFIAGVYGMNFDPQKSPFNMPELGWYYGYPFALALMLVVALLLLVFFKRKKWL